MTEAAWIHGLMAMWSLDCLQHYVKEPRNAGSNRRLTLQNETEESKLKDKLADKLLYASCNIGTLVYVRNYPKLMI
jgi:hypothetical protein